MIANGLLKKKTGGSWSTKEFYPIEIIEKLVVQSESEIEAIFTQAIQQAAAQPAKPKKKK